MASKPRESKAGSARSDLGRKAARLTAILGGSPGSKIEQELRRRAEAARNGKGALGEDAAELLCYAAGNGKTDLVTTLLRRGAKADQACAFDLPPYDPHDEEQEPTEADWFAEEGEPKRVMLRPLGAAVHNGHVDVARLLLDAGANIKADAGSGPPVYHAVRRGHATMVELLIDRGADLTVRDGSGDTLLYEAAGDTHADVVDLLLRAGADPNELNDSGSPPLIAASIRGDGRIVRALLAAGANVDPPAPTPKRVTNAARRMFAGENFAPPLVYAAEIGHLEVVRALLKAGADVARKDSYGNTAYDVARLKGHREIALLLKDAGAAAASGKVVDLFTAAEAGDVAGIRAALASGVKVNARSGLSERGFGSLMKGVDTKNLFGSVMDLLRSADADFRQAVENDAAEQRESAAWQHGMTALMLAAKHGHVEAVRALLDAGAAVNERSSDPQHSGYKALHYAAAAGHVQVMRLLLDAGADVADQAVDILGEPTCTPLHLAAGAGHAQAVRLLLEHGADPVDDAGGDTPLDRASARRHEEVARLLKAAAASARTKRAAKKTKKATPAKKSKKTNPSKSSKKAKPSAKTRKHR